MPPATDKPLILIIEDEADLITLLSYNLEKEGYRVIASEDGTGGMAKAESQRPDLILLDWMLPDMTGPEVARALRKSNAVNKVPIIMLTARSEEHDKIRGLNAGADDYVTKPFSPAELLARIKAVLRRVEPQLAKEELTFSDLTMNLISHRVTRGKTTLDLGPTEFRLLRHFMENPGRVYSREQLLDQVWGNDIYVEARTVDVHIRRLRKNIGEPDVIRTVRGAGYALEQPGKED